MTIIRRLVLILVLAIASPAVATAQGHVRADSGARGPTHSVNAHVATSPVDSVRPRPVVHRPPRRAIKQHRRAVRRPPPYRRRIVDRRRDRRRGIGRRRVQGLVYRLVP